MRYEQEHTPSGDETYQRTWREFGSDWRGSEPFLAALEFMGVKKNAMTPLPMRFATPRRWTGIKCESTADGEALIISLQRCAQDF